MINLLAPDDRRQLVAARTNSLLLRYALLLGVFILLLVAEMGGAYVVLSTEKARNEAIILENEQKTQQYASVKADATRFSTNLTTAKYILDQQVPYTTVILKLASVLPSDAVFEKLTIDPNTFGTSTTLLVRTTSYARSVDVKTSLQNSGIFSDVNFQSVVQGTDTTYPYTATYNVTYSKDLLKKL